MSDTTTTVVHQGGVHQYISPTMTTLALLGEELGQDGVVAILFEHIPLLQRRRIGKMLKSNFLLQKHKRVSVRFDKLVLPGKTVTGIVVTLKG